MKKNTIVKIVQDEKNTVEKSILANSIVRLSKAADELRKASGLNDTALILLISASSRVGKPDVTAVLRSLENLKRDYCR
jgi:hypothetical protein